MQKFVLFSLTLLLLVACSPDQGAGTGAQKESSMADKDTVDEGKAWLAENAKKEGVLMTESGLQYQVINSGEGASPALNDVVVTHYTGAFLDGKVFDSSVERGQPAEFPVSGVIKAWTEALQMMKEGDKWTLFVPPELGYGERGVGPIPGNTVLIFDVELIEVKGG
jgi:FKBP-type peptidyl-prolyl cis-trans isomerase FklB